MKKGEKAICPACGEEFTRKTNRSSCCSNKCNKRYLRLEHRTVHKKICAHCGKEFETTNSTIIYCSKTCAEEVRRAKALAYSQSKRIVLDDKPCDFCGEMFTPRTKRGRFCCEECKKKYHAMKVKDGISERVYAPKICARCGKEYIPTTGSSKYCGDECRNAAASHYWKKYTGMPVDVDSAEPCEKVIAKLNRPAKRWAKMSWTDVTLENEYYGFSYKESQIRAYAGTLPEDYGLKRKKAK